MGYASPAQTWIQTRCKLSSDDLKEKPECPGMAQNLLVIEMDDDPTQKTTVLQGLGLFKIWTTLILTPLLVLALIAAMIFFSGYQKNWKTSTATVIADVNECPPNSNTTNGWTCAVKVTVDGLPSSADGIDLKVDVPQSSVASRHTFQVAYDPAKPEQTLTTAVLTPGGRMTIEVVLGVVLLLAVVFFVLNLTLRKSKTWQNVSGVMEGADIASALLRR